MVLLAFFVVSGEWILEGRSVAANDEHLAQIVDALPHSFERGRHHFFLNASETATGQSLLVPVVVIEGAKPGRSMLISAGVHGDELNGIRVIHRLADIVAPDQLTGRLLLIPGLNQTGLLANNRHFIGSGGGGFMVDLNRSFPGNAKGGTADRFLDAVWRGVIKDRVDLAIDLHTQTRGTAYPLFVFADFRNTTARGMAFALLPQMIKNDVGEDGTLETSLLRMDIPAVTFEIGEPKRFQADLVEQATLGVLNTLRYTGLLSGPVTKPRTPPVVGDRYTNVNARRGGIAVIEVALGDRLERGDLVARLYDPFGVEVDRYHAPHAGHVLAIATDPLREPGAMLVRILE